MPAVRKRYFAIMILCFLYSGFALLACLFLIYTAFWLPDISHSFVSERPFDQSLFTDGNVLVPNRSVVVGFRSAPTPLNIITSPFFVLILVSGIISLLAGLAIMKLTREKEINSIKKQTTDNLLLPDEKIVIDILKESGFELTQSKLAKESGLGKVQIHRTIRRLESKGVLEKHKYGLTNKIILKKELFE